MPDTTLCTTAKLWNQPRNPTAEGFISVKKGGKGRRKDEEGGRRIEGEGGGRKRGKRSSRCLLLADSTPQQVLPQKLKVRPLQPGVQVRYRLQGQGASHRPFPHG